MQRTFPAPPALDDRQFEDLVQELLARVPAHTPEWVPQQGDPGRTLIELFAWLADTILYRANLIPEKQRMAFLNLLGKPLQPAQAASGLVQLSVNNPEFTNAILVARESTIPGRKVFETREEINVLPVVGECYIKRRLSEPESIELLDVLDELKDFHQITDEPIDGYITEQVFSQDHSNTSLDIAQESIDNTLWIGLLAPTPASVTSVRETLAGRNDNPDQMLNLGFSPSVEIPERIEDTETTGAISFTVSISTNEFDDEDLVYIELDKRDATNGLKQQGVCRVQLPNQTQFINRPEGDVRLDFNAGLGNRPPRLDDPEKISRVVSWLRIDIDPTVQFAKLKWAGINVAAIDQHQTIRSQVVGQSSGVANQEIKLPWGAINKNTIRVEVTEPGRGYIPWYHVDDLALQKRDDNVYVLDPALATLTFGNGINGRIPEPGERIRVVYAQAGGGSEGNLPVGNLAEINALDFQGNPITQALTLFQPVATTGGVDAETLAEAELRLPGWLKNRNRTVVESDYQQLAEQTPGVSLGRVEILPKFLPQQRRDNVPGVVSVMVWPDKEITEFPNPRIDKPLIEKVYHYLDVRKPITTELYVIGCEYIPLALSVAISVRDGFGRDSVILEVKDSLKKYLWSLAPHGPFGEGWPLGRTVGDRELEVVAARVPGVNGVGGINLFEKTPSQRWKIIQRNKPSDPIYKLLLKWQLPELMGVVVNVGSVPVAELTGSFGSHSSGDSASGIAVPVIPEVC